MISIIISAYNAEKTIKKAIKSCLNQTYKDLEIIVVDDCSTDNTNKVVKKLAAKDSRIKYYKNEENKGAGYSRKIGVSKIQGEYSCFLDSDDYIAKDYIKTLYNYALKYNTELVSSGIIGVYGKEITHNAPNKVEVLEGKDKYKVNSQAYKFLTGCLIKSSLWNKVEYSENRFIEDTPTLAKLIWYTNKRVYVPYSGYYYVQNKNSLIHQSSKFKNCIYRALCSIEYIKFFKDKCEEFSNIDLLKRNLIELFGMETTQEEYNYYEDKLKYILDFFNNYQKE